MNYSLINCKHGLMLTEDNDMISLLLRFYGEWAENSINLIEPLIPAGGVVVDVGANIGTISLAFAKSVGASGTVLAFEAQQRVFYNLCANILINNLCQVEAHHCLIGAQENVTHLTFSENDNISAANLNRGGKSFLPNLQNPSAAVDKNRIQIHALDTYLDAYQRCDLIKIDVEGAEPLVLAGLRNTLMNKSPYLYVECGSEQLLNQLMPIFAAVNYRAYWHPSLHFNPNNFRTAFNITHSQGDMNLLCIPSSRFNSEHKSIWETLHQVDSWQQVDRLFPGFKF